jgi:hypothetical protein
MGHVNKKYLKRTIEVRGSDYEFFLTLGAGRRYRGELEDRRGNNMERWGLTKINAHGTPQKVLTHRFDFSVNEASDLRAVAELFIEQLGVTNYSLAVVFG